MVFLENSIHNSDWFRSMLGLIMFFKFPVTSYTFCVSIPFTLSLFVKPEILLIIFNASASQPFLGYSYWWGQAVKQNTEKAEIKKWKGNPKFLKNKREADELQDGIGLSN